MVFIFIFFFFFACVQSASQKHPNGGKPIHAPDSVTARENAAKVAMAIVYNKTLPPKPQTTTPLPPPPPLTASVTDGLLLTEKDKKKTHYIDRRRHQKTKSQSQKWVGSQYPSSSSHQGMYRMHSGYFYCYYPLCGGPSNFHGMMGHGFQPQAQGQSQGEGQWCWWWNPNFCIAPPPLSPLQMMYPPPNGLQLLPPPGYQHYPLPQTEVSPSSHTYS